MVIYLIGLVLVTVGAFTAGKCYNDEDNPAPHPLRVSVIAGMLWPLVVVGVVELLSVMVLAKVQSGPAPEVGSYA